jgi:hypothetical protein
MHKHIFLIIICFLIVGCSQEPMPVEVKGKLDFGVCSISPPRGFWYYPGKYPGEFRTRKDLLLITFYEDKETALKMKDIRKQSSNEFNPDILKVFFNFSLTVNNYKNLNEYYGHAQFSGIQFNELPDEADILKSEANWSCKQKVHGLYVIECVSLGKHLATAGVAGNNKADVLAKAPLLKSMLGSFVENQK